MTETRSVVVRLSAETAQYIASMQAAGKVSADAMTKVEKSTAAASQAQGKATKATSALSGELDNLGINAKTAALGGVAVIGASALTASADFDQAMSAVQAATHETESGMESLRDAALQAGADTSFSATEAAAGIENLAKAGLSAEDILDGGLSGSLDLAAAGGLGVADAAEAAAGALAQFKLEGDQATHVADLLAAGAGKAQGDVSDMVMALKQAGTVSAQTGLSLEETVGALSAMAEQSLLGSDAGTSFKTMLAALTPNSAKAAKAMEQYNIHAFDAQGNFVGMTELAGQLQAGLGDLTDEQRAMALETIFGSDAVRAASIIYDNGAEGIAKWTANVDDAGYAAETAGVRLDNLKGDVEALKGALETAFIEGGSGDQDMLRGITQLATDTVNLTTETEKAGGVLGGLRDSAMGALNPIGNLGSMYSGLKGELTGADEKSKDLDDSTESLAQSSTVAAGGMEAMAASAEGVRSKHEAAADAVEDFGDTLDRLNEKLDGRADLRDYQAAIDDFTDSIKKNGNTFDINTAKGRENQERLDGIASSALSVAENMRGAARTKFLTNAIDDIRTMGNQMGLPKSEVRALIELLKEANAADVKPKISANTAEAQAKVAALKNSIESLRDRDLTITTVYKVVRNTTDALPARAEGGQVLGPGTTTSDSILARLSNKEYVIKAEAVDHYGVGFFDAANAMRLAGGGSTDGKKRKPPEFTRSDDTESDRERARREAREARQAERAERYYDLQERAQREAEQRAEDEARIADAVREGQERAWNMATDAARAQKDAAQSMLDSVKANMERLGNAAVAGFDSPLFKGDQQRGLRVGGGAPGWRGALEGDIEGLKERSSLITALSDPGLGLSADALEQLLGQASNEQIRDMLAAGEVDDYARLFAERARLTGDVKGQAGMAGYGTEWAAANTELSRANGYLERIAAAIAGARPINVTETVSTQALAAELARLQAAAGGY